MTAEGFKSDAGAAEHGRLLWGVRASSGTCAQSMVPISATTGGAAGLHWKRFPTVRVDEPSSAESH